MKVALVCDWFHPRVGGIELHLRDLAARLAVAGHEVVVVTGTPGAIDVDGIRTVRIDAPRAPHFGFLITPAGVRAIGDALSRERVDVAHCHVSIVAPTGLGGAYHAQRLGIPTVVTFHSIVPATPVLARAARVALSTNEWPAVFSAVSARVAREVRLIGDGRPLSILPNGIDVDFWRSVPRASSVLAERTLATNTSANTLELVSVMRLNPKKRPLALVDIVARVVRDLPDKRVRLRVAGGGPERARLERAIAQRGLAGHIHLLGALTREQIRDLLSSADLFVLPTVRESFGLAALEARCAGVPVVAMRASGVAEFIAHDREGLLATNDSELAGAVCLLGGDEERRRRIADHNRNTMPPFDWPRVLSAHEEIYRGATALRDSVRADNTR